MLELIVIILLILWLLGYFGRGIYLGGSFIHILLIIILVLILLRFL